MGLVAALAMDVALKAAIIESARSVCFTVALLFFDFCHEPPTRSALGVRGV
jgi:hypothetical protein